MSDTDVSIAAISSQKLASVGQKVEVAVAKKALDQQGAVTQQLIAGATQKTLPEGVGAKVNTVA